MDLKTDVNWAWDDVSFTTDSVAAITNYRPDLFTIPFSHDSQAQKTLIETTELMNGHPEVYQASTNSDFEFPCVFEEESSEEPFESIFI